MKHPYLLTVCILNVSHAEVKLNGIYVPSFNGAFSIFGVSMLKEKVKYT